MSRELPLALVSPPAPAAVDHLGRPRLRAEHPGPISPTPLPAPAADWPCCLQSARLVSLLAEPLRSEQARRDELARLAALAPRAASD
jgi:hypothetical protein